MQIKLQFQRDTPRERVRARYAMIIPILRGMLNATARHIVDQAGGRDAISFEMFARVYAEGSGDYGICFDYAVHDAIRRRDATIYPLVSEVLEDFCKIKDGAESILFGMEKNRAARVLETAKDSLTEASRILVGKVGMPPFLRKRLDQIAAAFHKPTSRLKLPQSIAGLWKADLFIGSPASERWIAATLKTNRSDFESAPGLRLGLYPDERRDAMPHEDGDLIMCPLPYSGEFMQLFGVAFNIVRQIIEAKGKMPKHSALIYDDDRTVAQFLVERGRFPVAEILDALAPLAQPGLIEEQQAPEDEAAADATEALAPMPIITR